MHQFKRGVAVIGANPVAVLVVHSRKLQTESPVPSSLPSTVWDLSSGNRGTSYCRGAAGSGVGVTAEAAEGRAGLQRGGQSRGVGQGQAGSLVSGSNTACCTRDLCNHGSLCSCSVVFWLCSRREP